MLRPAALQLLEDWIPQSASAVGYLAGPLVVLGYLAGSVPFAYLLTRRRLRRQLDDPGLAGVGPPPPDRAGAGLDGTGSPGAAALAVVATLAVATLAWHLTLAATPGAGTFSAVAVFSNQAIGAWVSVALWTGTAAVVGHVAPLWSGFRGGNGLPPAVALLAVYAPLVLLASTGAVLVTFGLTRQHRPALAAALATMVVFEYLAWLGDLQAGWGVTNGPEVTLWTAALAGILAARNLRAAPAGRRD